MIRNLVFAILCSTVLISSKALAEGCSSGETEAGISVLVQLDETQTYRYQTQRDSQVGTVNEVEHGSLNQTYHVNRINFTAWNSVVRAPFLDYCGFSGSGGAVTINEYLRTKRPDEKYMSIDVLLANAEKNIPLVIEHLKTQSLCGSGERLILESSPSYKAVININNCIACSTSAQKQGFECSYSSVSLEFGVKGSCCRSSSCSS